MTALKFKIKGTRSSWVSKDSVLSIVLLLCLLGTSCDSSDKKVIEKARAEMGQGNPRKAIEAISSMHSPEKSSESLIIRGVAFVELSLWDSAVLDFNQAISLDPTNYKPYYNRALVRIEQGEPAEALEDYNKALKLDPSVTDIYLNRGALQFMLNKYSEAIYDFEKVLEKKSLDPQAMGNLGYMYLSTGNFQGAKAQYQKLLETDSLNSRAHFGLGRALIELGDQDKGCTHLQKSLELGYASAIKILSVYCKKNAE